MADSTTRELQDNATADQSLNDTSGRKHDGLIGLVNIGNSCYMNASLQALSNCQPFCRFFIECFPSRQDSPSPASCAISQLFEKMWISERNPGHLNPRNISSNMQQRMFRGSSQQDAQEFIRSLLNQIHEELSLPVYQNLTIIQTEDVTEESSRQPEECTISVGSISSTSSTGSSTRLMGISENNSQSTEVMKSNSLPNSLKVTEKSVKNKSNDLQKKIFKSQHLSSEVSSNHETKSIETKSIENDEEKLGDGEKDTVGNKEDLPLWDIEDTIVIDLMTGKAYKHHHKEDPSINAVSGMNQQIEKKNEQVKRSIITEIFEGELESSVECLHCHNVSTIKETFQDLSLPIPGRKDATNNDSNEAIEKEPRLDHTPSLSAKMCRVWKVVYSWARDSITESPTSLDSCFNAFFDTSDLTGENRYYCEHCNSLQNSRKRAVITKLPEILCVHLKRFRYDTFFASKISKLINFPLTDLNLVKYMKNADDTDHLNCKYELVSMVMHYGGASGGHYIAFARNYKTGRWHEFNDSRVTQVSTDTVAESEAYLLFYRKIPNTKISKLNIADIIPPPDVTIPSEDTSYISRHWLMLHNLCVNPGPLLQYHYACQHGGILPGKEQYSELLVLPIQRSIWNDLVKTYGGGTLLESTKTCTKCRDYFSELKLRRETEKDEANKVQAADKPSPNCYILSTYWLKQWQSFINCNSKSLVSEVGPPGPINNSCLLQSTKDMEIKFRSKSQYRTISYKVWRYLFDIYGGGPHLTTRSPETLEL